MWVFFFGGGGLLIGSLTSRIQTVSNSATKTTAAKSPTAVAKLDTHTKKVGQIPPEPNDLKLTIKNQQQKIAQLQKQLQLSCAIKLCTNKSVVFMEGYSYRIGETIDFGIYKGKKVKAIDWPRRIVYLSDGTILRMGH